MTTALAALPECPRGHGRMVLRAPRSYTKEQAWCGVWYDCPPGPFHCASSHLFQSAELLAVQSGGAR